MPISEKEKEQLLAIIGKMDGMELVRFGGMVYDGLIALKNHVGIQKTIVLGKYISANVPWTGLTTLFPGEKEQKSMQELRLNVLRSAEENILRKFPTIFTLVPEEPAAAPAPGSVEAVPTAAPTPPAQVATQVEDDPTTHMESVPGGDTELPPPGADESTKESPAPGTIATAATTDDAGSDAATDAAINELEMAGGEDDDDHFAGLDDEETEQPEATPETTPAEAKGEPTPAVTPEPSAKPAEQAP